MSGKFLATAIFVASAIAPAMAQDKGLITLPSAYSPAATIEKFETVARASGMKVFARIDHSAAAKEAGMNMPASTVIIFGAPKTGTPMMMKQATLAIDLPLKALVWQDSSGKTFLAYNSAAYVLGTIFGRHGLKPPEAAVKAQESMLANLAAAATK
ncbi:MAG: DUF302 domain-containing protein [Alphaproteobacteria bacterium]|nr:DUF302 domain-containing protein [Alphaproteobacteria bacterium]